MSSTAAERGTSDYVLDRLYRHHRADVYRFVRRGVRNHEDAEDVTQAAFLQAYRALQHGVRPEKPRAWLLTIAQNVARRRFRAYAVRPHEVELDPELAAAPQHEGPAAAEIREALSRLRPNYRAAVVLREIGGLSYAEIARSLGLSVSAVETLLFRARRTLRDELAAEAPASAGRRKDAVPGVLWPLPELLARAFGHVAGWSGKRAVSAKFASVVGAGVMGAGVALQGSGLVDPGLAKPEQLPAKPTSPIGVSGLRDAPLGYEAARATTKQGEMNDDRMGSAPGSPTHELAVSGTEMSGSEPSPSVPELAVGELSPGELPLDEVVAAPPPAAEAALPEGSFPELAAGELPLLELSLGDVAASALPAAEAVLSEATLSELPPDEVSLDEVAASALPTAEGVLPEAPLPEASLPELAANELPNLSTAEVSAFDPAGGDILELESSVEPELSSPVDSQLPDSLSEPETDISDPSETQGAETQGAEIQSAETQSAQAPSMPEADASEISEPPASTASVTELDPANSPSVLEPSAAESTEQELLDSQSLPDTNLPVSTEEDVVDLDLP